MSEQRRAGGWLATLGGGGLIGGVEVILAVAFAGVVFSGRLVFNLAEGIGVFLVAAAVTLAAFALLAGGRGMVGGLQGAPAAMVGAMGGSIALATFGSTDRAFLTVVVATLIVTVVTGVAVLLLGTFRLANLVRFIPYPVVGGFLAGMGWLLIKGGVGFAAGTIPTVDALTSAEAVERWLPALGFGLVLVIATRVIKHPLVTPAVIALGLIGFAIWTLVTGLSVEEARSGRWVIGDLGSSSTSLWEPWSLRGIAEADWSAIVAQVPAILTAIFVAVIALVSNVTSLELMFRSDLDANRELRHAGITNVAVGAVGGSAGFHAVSSTALGRRMRASVRVAGAIAALVPLAAAVVGAEVIGMLPRLVVGGVAISVGLGFIAEWVLDARRALPRGEYVVVLVILATVIARGPLVGTIVAAVAALVLFAVNYGRTELLHEVEFGATFRSNVDRPPEEHAALAAMRDRVQILRLDGFVFFGSANALLERVRRRVRAGGVRFLVIDLRRVTGMDASALVLFRKIDQLAGSGGIELILAGVSDGVRRQLERGGVGSDEGVVRFVPDLDRGLERCEEGLLREAALGEVPADGALAGMPARLERYLERVEMPEGTVLIRQDEPPEDVFVLASGRLRVEMVTPEGRRMRLRTVRPGVVVGEVAMYTGTPRTADVVADSPVEVLRLSRDAIERLEAEEPDLAAALHRWLARILAARMSDTLRAFDALLD